MDRLGSVVTRSTGAGTVANHRYYPYGEEIEPTVGDRNKFATYHRDQTGVDYADQRYYFGTKASFITPDPSGLNWSLQDPSSFNNNSYSNGDPVNKSDPSGLTTCGELPITSGQFAGRTVASVMRGTSGPDLLAQLIFHEAGEFGPSDAQSPARFVLELLGIGTAILNHFDIDNGSIHVFDEAGNRVFPLGGSAPRGRSLKEIIIMVARDERGFLFNQSGEMRESGRNRLNEVLDTNVASGPLAWDSTGGWINHRCLGMLASLNIAGGLLTGNLNDRYKPDGLVLLFWNKASSTNKTDFPGSVGFIGVDPTKVNGHTFWGLRGRAFQRGSLIEDPMYRPGIPGGGGRER